MTSSATLHVRATATLRGGKLLRDGQVVGHSYKQSLADIADELYAQVQMEYPRFYKEDLQCKTGMLAAHVLLNDWKAFRAEEVAVVLMNRSGSLDADIKYQATVDTIPSPALFVYTLPNILIGEICIRYGFKGENLFLVSEHFDAELLTQTVTQLFDEGTVKYCICGWCEATTAQHECLLWLVEINDHAAGEKIFNTETCKTQYLNNHG